MRVFTDKRSGKPYVEIATRAPTKMQIYAKTLAFAHARTLKGEYREAAEQFFNEKPWEHGLKWRPTKGLTATLRDTIGQKEATGWMQVNMRFPVEIGNQLDRLAAEQGVSLSSVCYTLLYWWTWWIYPPASERRRREEYLRNRQTDTRTKKPGLFGRDGGAASPTDPSISPVH
ncbi:hypothetical protein A5904_05560 [Acidithiobacillus caldus]|uniref:Uncharacterized protein n=2 Tax=Acidithiobacillus caldus TaxID=33059 RepID=A0A1E7YP79_9PROT|nr:hypothetical protein [Acidithiobacillus caldus]AUW32500.1 hypothetical protein A5904_05560 [Acidithiobacillus caldus]OFC36892.1 hypothetical protein BAE27_05025 [Acidithiobacillus caldus]OFC37850.1 hypothetical protein BAE28_06665 [Acidithiobacillus caldus]OFC41279.1 hypothetical protein BAE29_03255 [Acidithiobacillus caldus]